MSSTNLCCPICQRNVSLNEEVNIDIFNTILHKSCKKKEVLTKESGTFEEIMERYPFFETVLIH